MQRGRFITFEGGEGAGKSTQAKKLAEFLRRDGREIVVTREVGGCPSAEDIRTIWLGKGEDFWDATTELLLINAARREHLVKVIKPALARGAWVVSDRFVDSTRAYQGIGMKLGIDKVDALYRMIAGDFEADMTLLLDLPVDVGAARVASRAGMDDRYQQKPAAFHQRLRDGYLGLARAHADRFVVIDATREAEPVHKSICTAVVQRFPELA